MQRQNKEIVLGTWNPQEVMKKVEGLKDVDKKKKKIVHILKSFSGFLDFLA